MRILLCTDGSPHGQEALRYGASLAQHSGQPATLLGVLEHPSERAALQQALDQGKEWLAGAPEPRILVREGHPGEEILDEAALGKYDLVVVGARGRRGITRLLMGSTAERIARHAKLPVLIVRGEHEAVRRILLCTAGGAPGLRVVEFGGEVARMAGAEAIVLHVMSQLPALATTSADTLADLEATAEDLMAHEAREGKHLQEALKILEGLEVPARALVRHGLVVDEVGDEACAGAYDLVVVGAHSASGLMRLLLKDVGHEIMNCCMDRPMLVVRT